MNDRGRAFLIFGVVGAIAAGAGYYFFEIYRPAQVNRDAQAEVTAWEARWALARGCLLGATPGSSKTSEALSIHELAPDPWDRGACTGLMSKLTRGDAPDTGLPTVEAAWRELEHAATKAAAAFAEHVAGASHGAANDPLPDALDALDAARATLRKAAGLSIDTQRGAPLANAQQLALVDGSDPVTQLDLHGPASARGLVVFGMTKAKHGVQVVLPSGGAPVVSRVPDGTARGVPDPSWAAAIDSEHLDIGSADTDGDIAQPIATSIPKIATIAAVVGTLANGTIIYGTNGDKGGTLGIAHAGSGAITVDPPMPASDGFTVIDPGGHGFAAWSSGDRHSVLSFTPERVERAFPIDAAVDVACLSNDTAWAAGEQGAAEFGSLYLGASSTKPDADGDLIACLADGALFRAHVPDEVAGTDTLICATAHVTRPSCRTVHWPAGAPKSAALTAIGGKLVAVAIHGDVLGVWREAGGAPTFYGLPATLSLVAPTRTVATDGKVIDALARDAANNYVVVRVPAS